MREVLMSEMSAISGGENSWDVSDDPQHEIDCQDFVLTCLAQDIQGAAEALGAIATAIWNGIFTAVDILACNVFPEELREPLTEMLGIENPCGGRN
jgi:hypothetical protein